MKQSFLMRRVFFIVALGIVLTILLTTITYSLFAQTIFTYLREEELSPKAKALGELAQEYLDGRLDRHAFSLIMGEHEEGDGDSLLGAYALVLDADGEVLFSSSEEASRYRKIMSREIESVLAGNPVTASRRLRLVQANAVIVGTPVLAEDGSVRAAVILLVPMVEILASVNSVNSALVISMAVVLPIIGVATYILADRFAKPMRQMNAVALAMAGGDFSARADQAQGGEIGELGRSLNFLARELSKTISDLTLERNRLRDVIDGLSEGIVAVDREGSVTHSNTALANLFAGERVLSDGSPAAQRLGLIPFQEVWEDFDRVLATGEHLERVVRSGEKSLRVTITPLGAENGTIAGAVGLISDITNQERLERTRREYVANVSHELRTPLTALRGLVEPMRDGLVKTEEARQRYYNIILRETMRLSRLIDDLMELSRLQSGTLSLECSPVRLSTILEDLREKYQGAAEDHGLTFSLECDPQKAPVVWSNADRVEQALVILLDNAIKYTPEGGRVTLSGRRVGDRYELSVSDTGVGIAKEEQALVFERFYKVDKAHSGMGSGLGLSIAREMLRRLDSDLLLESEPGKGSTFRFSLPIHNG